MKIIRITTDNEISVHGFPEGSIAEQNRQLRALIGICCELYEHVMPNRLYTSLGASKRVTRTKGSCTGMLVDEEGVLRELDINAVGSYLYEGDKHGGIIAGNILIVGEYWDGDGVGFCGMSENQFNLLYPKLEELTLKAREML